MKILPGTLVSLKSLIFSACCMLISACGGGGGNSDFGGSALEGSLETENTAPIVASSPELASSSPQLQATAGELYTLVFWASDPDGDVLVFSASGLPSWLSFDNDTGRLSGIPTAADAGITSTVQVWVSDGTVTVQLPPFVITVNPAHTGSATLSWVPPVARVDGSSLAMSEIAGYTVYYGTTSGTYPNALDVDNGATTTATIDSLLPATYYVVVTTRDSDGRQSGFSREVVKVVDASP